MDEGLVEPKAVGTGAGVASVEGSVGNAVSALNTVVALMYRRRMRHANLPKPSPSENEYHPVISTNSNFPSPRRWLFILNPSSLVVCLFAAKGVIVRSQQLDTDGNHTQEVSMIV
jgi:hypothetical protein